MPPPSDVPGWAGPHNQTNRRIQAETDNSNPEIPSTAEGSATSTSREEGSRDTRRHRSLRGRDSAPTRFGPAAPAAVLAAATGEVPVPATRGTVAAALAGDETSLRARAAGGALRTLRVRGVRRATPAEEGRRHELRCYANGGTPVVGQPHDPEPRIGTEHQRRPRGVPSHDTEHPPELIAAHHRQAGWPVGQLPGATEGQRRDRRVELDAERPVDDARP